MIFIDEWFNTEPPATPEEVLWLAVIERAILDYAFPTIGLSIKHRNSLQWFFFTEEPEPHNLLYLCQILFDHPDAANEIKARINDLKNDQEVQDTFLRSKRYRGYY
jgi:hypothetical protein